MIRIPASKTNQPRRGADEVRVVYRRIGKGPCPVKLLQEICLGRMGCVHDPVFELEPGIPIKRSTISRLLEVLAKEFGLEPRRYITRITYRWCHR